MVNALNARLEQGRRPDAAEAERAQPTVADRRLAARLSGGSILWVAVPGPTGARPGS